MTTTFLTLQKMNSIAKVKTKDYYQSYIEGDISFTCNENFCYKEELFLEGIVLIKTSRILFTYTICFLTFKAKGSLPL